MQAGRTLALSLAAILLLTLAACSVREAARESVTVTGALSYRERIALPPDATVTVTLSDVSLADAPAPVIAEQSAATAERQVPLAFALTVRRAALEPRRSYALSGRIRDSQGQLLWITDSHHPVDPAQADSDLGVLMMVRVAAPGATGAGMAEAGMAEAGAPAPLDARGNEPPWQLTVTQTAVQLRRGYDSEEVTLPAPTVVPLPNGRVYTASSDSHSLRAVVIETLCHDSMAGLPYPLAVTLQIDGARLEGCGGRPAALLQGAEWVVEDIDNGGIIDFSRATLTFGEDGRLSGRASCNTYSATYELTGENLIVGPTRTTRRACATALNDQEQRFLEILAAVRSFDISASGALILRTADGQTITARKQ